MVRRVLTVLLVLYLIPMCLCCSQGSLPGLRGQVELLFGWALFVYEVVPKMSVNWLSVATAVVRFGLVTAGVHSFGGWLWRARRPAAPPWRLKWSLGLVAIVVLAFAAGIAVVGITHQTVWLATSPEPILAPQGGVRENESAAIGALKTIGTAEAVFREGDKDQNGVLDYGSLDQLGATGMVDSVLGSGTKQGYFFVAGPSPITSEFLWFATASPADERAGKLWCFTNQGGVIFYTTGGPFHVDRGTCEVPPGLVPAGR